MDIHTVEVLRTIACSGNLTYSSSSDRMKLDIRQNRDSRCIGEGEPSKRLDGKVREARREQPSSRRQIV